MFFTQGRLVDVLWFGMTEEEFHQNAISSQQPAGRNRKS